MPGRRGDLLSADVGDGVRRLAENPGVDHDRLAAEGAYPLAHVLDLGALGIKGPDQRDARSRTGWPHEIFDFAGTPVHSAHLWTAPRAGPRDLLLAVSQVGRRGLDIT